MKINNSGGRGLRASSLGRRGRKLQRARLRESIHHLIAFAEFGDLPAGEDVGDAAVGFNAPNYYFADEFAFTTDRKDAVLHKALCFSDVENDEVPFGIDDEHRAVHWRQLRNSVGRENRVQEPLGIRKIAHKLVVVGLELRQFRGQFFVVPR